ncbi:HNH endonuclease [Bacillus anthracis]|nr:HNH endonuclease [Bacillus anthracis]
MDRIGSYCSYCERSLGGNVAVEHIQPKSLHKELALTWDNFLLACVNCNSIKSNQSINLEEYLWPDKDNTLLAFHYGRRLNNGFYGFNSRGKTASREKYAVNGTKSLS